VVKGGFRNSPDTTHDASLRLYAQRFNVQVELTGAAELIESWRPDL